MQSWGLLTFSLPSSCQLQGYPGYEQSGESSSYGQGYGSYQGNYGQTQTGLSNVMTSLCVHRLVRLFDLKGFHVASSGYGQSGPPQGYGVYESQNQGSFDPESYSTQRQPKDSSGG